MSKQTKKDKGDENREHHKDHMAGLLADKQPCDQTKTRQNKTVEKGDNRVPA